jgi:hypothetical protein
MYRSQLLGLAGEHVATEKSWSVKAFTVADTSCHPVIILLRSLFTAWEKVIAETSINRTGISKRPTRDSSIAEGRTLAVSAGFEATPRLSIPTMNHRPIIILMPYLDRSIVISGSAIISSPDGHHDCPPRL